MIFLIIAYLFNVANYDLLQNMTNKIISFFKNHNT